MTTRLTLVRNGARPPAPSPSEDVLVANELKQWVLRGGPVVSLARYRESRVLTPDLTFLGRPLAFGLLARWCARGTCYIEDEQGRRQSLSMSQLARWGGAMLREPLQRSAYVARMHDQVKAEEASLTSRPRTKADWEHPCAYFRTDLSYAVKAGGSVGHIAGVLNSLATFGHRPMFVTTDNVPTVLPEIETVLVPRSERFWHYRELPAMVMHETFLECARRVLAGRPLSFIYQRYSLHNFAGVVLSRERCVPLVIEYNGSESWVGRHWGHALEHQELADRIEMLNMRAADVVVVVSDVNRDELIARGVSADRILLNPNGVDTERYHPAVDGSAVRRRYDLEGKLVVGFIGTFGPWHGAEVLAEAYGRLLARRPDLRERSRLLMIGDGARAPRAREILEVSGHGTKTVWTGIVPQAEGASHLAACDVLVSPHVPNPDGSRFFGSPTKLFEYMAMGRPIVASNLEQIGEILRHQETAWLVPPADVQALEQGIERVLDDADLRGRLAACARDAVVARWSWREHTARILEALRAREGETH